MSNVEFQAGIESVSPKKDTIELKLILANVSAADSALIAWLNEAIRTGTLHTIAITVDEADEAAEGQLRLFEDFITEHTPARASEIVREVSREIRRRGRRQGHADGHLAVGGGSIAVVDAPEDEDENSTEDLDSID